VRNLHLLDAARRRVRNRTMMVEKSEPPANIFSALESTDSTKKYIMEFGIHDNKMAALSNIKNKV
jgi:hypothetical protein